MHLEASWSLLKPLGSLLEASGSFLKPRNQFVPRPLGNLLGSLLETSLDASWKPIKTFGVGAGVMINLFIPQMCCLQQWGSYLSFRVGGPVPEPSRRRPRGSGPGTP